MTKNWIGLGLAVAALAVSVSTGFACDQQAPAADAKDAKGAVDDKAVAANATTKGCDMPCCAHAKEAASAHDAENVAAEKPCSAHDAKGCPKKATATAATAAKAEPAKEAPTAEPPATPGTNR